MSETKFNEMQTVSSTYKQLTPTETAMIDAIIHMAFTMFKGVQSVAAAKAIESEVI